MNNIKDYIITEADDQDLYKFSMANFYHFWNLLDTEVEWSLFNRGGIKFPDGFGEALQYQVDHMADLSFDSNMINHLLKQPFNFSFLKWLSDYKYDPKVVIIEDNGNKITVRGTLGQTTFWETQLMAIMSELYNFMTGNNEVYLEHYIETEKSDVNKFSKLKELDAKVIEFGMRRRFSKNNQMRVLCLAKELLGENLLGTSNVMFARKLNLESKGTIAHEIPMLLAALENSPLNINEKVLEMWAVCYGDKFNLALPDTFTTNKFLQQTNSEMIARLNGLRQDSGDPFSFTYKYDKWCKDNSINPSVKSITYSDSINNVNLVEKLININKTTYSFQPSFGIGTWLTNDIIGIQPVNWVIKLTKVLSNSELIDCELIDCVKLSDTPGKITTLNMKTAEDYKKRLGIPHIITV